VTSVQVQADARDQQARWDDWTIANARSDRRQRMYARIVAVIVFGAIASNLVVQLWLRL
jgi:hypothetical protein